MINLCKKGETMELRSVSGGRARCPVVWVGIALAILVAGTTMQAYGQGGAVVFVTNYLERDSFSTQPRPEQVKDTIHVFAAAGEYEPATFSIRSATELKNVHVEIGDDLKTDAGLTIPKSAVEIRLVDPFEKWTKRKVEYYLLKKTTVDIPAKTTRRFWVTVHVPNNAKPGLYRSKIAISKTMATPGPDLERSEALRTLTYEVQVLPIKLATSHETGMAYFMYNNTAYFARLPKGKDQLITEQYQTRVFEDMREHGMTTATVYLYPPKVSGKLSLTKRTSNHLGFIPTMQMLEKTKLVAPGLPIVWLRRG